MPERGFDVTKLYPQPRRGLAARFRPGDEVLSLRLDPSVVRHIETEASGVDVVALFSHGVALSWLAGERGPGDPRAIVLALGLPDRLAGATDEEVARATELLRRAQILLVMSDAEATLLRDLGLTNVGMLEFGVDTDYWTPGEGTPEDYVFSVGSDPRRDYGPLVSGCDRPLKIMTRATELLPSPLPDNVEIVQGDTEDLKRFYSSAAVVVVPVQDVLQPSGQNTVLQAMSMARPVVMTRAKGFWSDELRDGENCVLVPPGDDGAMRGAIEALMTDRGRAEAIGERARATVERSFDLGAFGDSLAGAIRAAMS